MFASLFIWTEAVLRQFHCLLGVSLLLYLGLRYFQLENPRAALLFSLALPGALVWAVAILVLAVYSSSFQHSLSAILVFFPASWILPLVTVVQAFKLRAAKKNVGYVGSMSAVLLGCLYVLTAALQRAS
jgi:hypothetical protein